MGGVAIFRRVFIVLILVAPVLAHAVTGTTAVQLQSNMNPSPYGGSVTFTAMVSASGGSPTGTVTFRDGSTALGTNPLTQLGSATNQLLYSSAVTASPWSVWAYANSSYSLISTSAPAPDGTNTATGFSVSGTGQGMAIEQYVNQSNIRGKTYTVSVFLRSDGACRVDLGTEASPTYEGASIGIDTTSHWQRYSVTYTYQQRAQRVSLYVLGAPGCTFYVWGTQLEQATTAGPYVPTGASPASGYGGVATLTTSTLTAGLHTISASYNGDANNSSSISGELAQEVVGSATATELASSSGLSSYGRPLTFTALVNTSGTRPTGSVTFNDGGTSVGTGAISEIGPATNQLVYSSDFTASAWGVWAYANSAYSLVTTTVSAPDGTNTATEFTVSGTGQGMAILQYVNQSSIPGKTFTASVFLRSDGTCRADLGTDSYPSYEGASIGIETTSTWQRYSVSYTYQQEGQRVSFYVLGAPGCTFYIWGPQLEEAGTVGPYVATAASPASGYGGVASLTTSSLPAGSHTITATYDGDGNNSSSNSAALILQITNGTSTDLMSSPNPSTYGQSVTLTALVDTSGGNPTGTVTFSDGGAAIDGSPLSQAGPILNILLYSYAVTSPEYEIWAYPTSSYSVVTTTGPAPDGSNTATEFTVSGAGQGMAIEQYVDQSTIVGKTFTASVFLRSDGPCRVDLGTESFPTYEGASIGIDATSAWQRYNVTHTYQQEGQRVSLYVLAASGCTFYLWGAQLQQAGTVGPYVSTEASAGSGYGGVATLTTSSLAGGLHSMTAAYGGDGNFIASTSPALMQTVEGGPPPTVPAAPSGLTATPAPEGLSVALTWTDNATNEDNYVVERCTGSNCSTFAALTSSLPANTTAYTDTSIAAGTTYRYRVTAVNAVGSSDYVTSSDVTTPSVPATPAIGTATAGADGTTATVTWSDVASETGYYVERCMGDSCTAAFTVVGNGLPANTVNFGDSGLTPGTIYGYRVRAQNAVGYSGYSATVYATTPTAPAGPTGLTATPAANALSVALGWTDNATNETNYVVERCTGSNCTTFSVLSSTVAANATSYTDSTTAAGTVYRYQVKAVNAVGSSSYVTSSDVTTPSVPATPVIGTATAGANGTTATVTWSDVATETGYYVERCSGASCTTGFTVVGSNLAANTVSFSDSGLTPGTTYGYRVRAQNAVGYSGYSATAYATTPTAPAAPTGLTATPAANGLSVALGWTDNATNETNYVVERCTGSNCTTFSVLSSTVAANATSYTDSTTAAGTVYRYQVKAVNAVGSSSYVTSSDVTTPSVPQLTSIAPTSGVVGTEVTITGTLFGNTQGGNTVIFYGVPATEVLSWNNTEIHVKVPETAVSGPVAVVIDGQATNAVNFTVLVPPAISGISPSSGPSQTPVTISGSNFGSDHGSSTATFSGTVAQIQSWSDNSIVALVPDGASTGPVIVTTAAGASNGIDFAVPPVIEGITPARGGIGSSFTLSGTNFGSFTASSAVFIGGVQAQTNGWNENSIVALVPDGLQPGQVPVTVTNATLVSNAVSFVVTDPLVVTPSNIGLLVGESQTLQVLDSDGTELKDGINWTNGNEDVVTLTTDADSVLTAKAAGSARIGVFRGDRTAFVDVTVYDGAIFPLGATRWVAPALGTGSAMYTFRAQQVDDLSPTFYVQENSASGSNIRALTGDGRQLWTTGASAWPTMIAADTLGGALANTADGDGYHLTAFDSEGKKRWQYATEWYDDHTAISPDGTVFRVQQPFGALPYVVALDATNGMPKATVNLPTGSDVVLGVKHWPTDPIFGLQPPYPTDNPYGNDYDACFPGSVQGGTTPSSPYGMSVSPDGTLNLPVEVYSSTWDRSCAWGDDDRYPARAGEGTKTYTSSIQVLRVSPQGAPTIVTLASETNVVTGSDTPHFGITGRAVPDGKGGVLVAGYHWTPNTGAPATTSYMLWDSDGTVFNVAGEVEEILIGEDGTVYALSGGSVSVYDAAGGDPRWTWRPTDGSSIRQVNMLTADGKIYLTANLPGSTDQLIAIDHAGQQISLLSQQVSTGSANSSEAQLLSGSPGDAFPITEAKYFTMGQWLGAYNNSTILAQLAIELPAVSAFAHHDGSSAATGGETRPLIAHYIAADPDPPTDTVYTFIDTYRTFVPQKSFLEWFHTRAPNRLVASPATFQYLLHLFTSVGFIGHAMVPQSEALGLCFDYSAGYSQQLGWLPKSCLEKHPSTSESYAVYQAVGVNSEYAVVDGPEKLYTQARIVFLAACDTGTYMKEWFGIDDTSSTRALVLPTRSDVGLRLSLSFYGKFMEGLAKGDNVLDATNTANRYLKDTFEGTIDPHTGKVTEMVYWTVIGSKTVKIY